MKNIILRKMIRSVKRYFIAGLILVLPLAVTYAVIKYLIVIIYESLPQNIIYRFVPDYLKDINILKHFDIMLSFGVTFVSIIIIGYFFSNFLGKKIFELLEDFLEHLPIINKIYSILKQIIEQIISNIQGKNKGMFNKVVYVEFPRKGLYSMGFLTSQNSKLTTQTGEKMFNVFVPTTPNPTSGYLVVAAEKELIVVDIKIEDAMKFIISGGMVTDPKQKVLEPENV
ncbi:DUF502 domain-containing protein [Candidatus Dependentiae bacterium]|nr:DUF502 domain-containing protein [Candidatus Dependentiae bacterium]